MFGKDEAQRRSGYQDNRHPLQLVPGLDGSKFSYQHRQRGQCSGYFNQAGRDPRRSGEKNSCKKAEKANQTRRRVLQCSEIVPAQTRHPARSGTRAAADTRSDPDGAQLQRAEKAAAGAFLPYRQKYQGKACRRQESRTEAAQLVPAAADTRHLQRSGRGISTVGRARGLSCSPAGQGICCSWFAIRNRHPGRGTERAAAGAFPAGRGNLPGKPRRQQQGSTEAAAGALMDTRRSWYQVNQHRQRAFLFTGTRAAAAAAGEPAAIGGAAAAGTRKTAGEGRNFAFRAVKKENGR